MKTPTFPFDSLDLKQSRDRKPREIQWDELEPERLSAPLRATLGEEWRARMVQEHLAVGAFAEITSELAQNGCDAIVLALASRASSDEVRHADVCGRIAMTMLGAPAVPRRLRGVPVIPPHVGSAPAERTLLHVVEMCCLSETLTGIYLTEMLARTTNLGMRSAIEFLLEDEIDHGRLGWAHLASAAREGRGGSVAAALPAMLERVVGPVMRAGETTSEARSLAEGYGQIDAPEAARIFAATLQNVILPGFETVGIDSRAARALVRHCGWRQVHG